MDAPIINRVANSVLLSIDLEEYFPEQERVILDIKDQLFHGLILKEKDFREYIKTEDWSKYKGKAVGIICSADAVIPTWAYMLIAQKLSSEEVFFAFGDEKILEAAQWNHILSKINIEEYRDKPVVIKGCFNKPVPVYAYTEITRILTPVVKSLMFGEPCSTVPVYKRK